MSERRLSGRAATRDRHAAVAGSARGAPRKERKRCPSHRRRKAIELAVASIEKAFGKGSILRLGNEEALVKDVEAVSSGSISLDIALGVGGFPRGHVIEIYGPESSGKTTLALHAVAEAQKKGGIAAFVDAEHALDVGYARSSACAPTISSSRSPTPASRRSRSRRRSSAPRRSTCS